MWLENLTLYDFRNYPKLNLTFGPHFNFIYGANGQGKTNLLEAIGFLCRLSSLHVPHPGLMVREGQARALACGHFVRASGADDIAVTIEGGRRLGRRNDKPIARVSLHRRDFPCLWFLPFEVYLFRLAPEGRRIFLDEAAALTAPGYAALLADYTKVLRQRNHFLKLWAEGRAGDPEWEVWSARLAGLASQVVAERQRILQALNTRLTAVYSTLAGDARAVRLAYHHAIAPGMEANSPHFYLEALRGRRQEERQRLVTLVGPHRDDFGATLGGSPIMATGSQGEHRSLVIALKFLLLELATQASGTHPIFLLDDVTNELDAERRGLLLAHLAGIGAQVFVTTTEADRALGYFQPRPQEFRVAQGQVA